MCWPLWGVQRNRTEPPGGRTWPWAECVAGDDASAPSWQAWATEGTIQGEEVRHIDVPERDGCVGELVLEQQGWCVSVCGCSGNTGPCAGLCAGAQGQDLLDGPARVEVPKSPSSVDKMAVWTVVRRGGGRRGRGGGERDLSLNSKHG